MPCINFTVRKIDSLRAPDRGQVDYWDTGLPGFGIRVSQGGRKSWIVMYRVGRRKRRLTLGSYPPMTLAEARKDAKAALVVAQKGGDPAHEKKVARMAETFSQLAESYIEQYAKPNKKSWKLDEKALYRDAVPRLGTFRAKDITRRDIRDMLQDIVARAAPIQANRTFEIVRRLFNWAIGEDYLTTNPCQGISKPAKENRRDRVLKEDEIRAVWQAMEAEQPLVAAMFKLRLVTAQRGGEVASMRWEDLDPATGWWTIPAERSKNGLSHRVPLSPQALAVLEDVRDQEKDVRDREKDVREQDNGSPWLFPSPKPGRHMEQLAQATKHIRERAGVEFVPHDLRRTAASCMTSMGIPRLTVKKILNHVERDVTATYDRHSYDHEKRQALDAWGRRLEEILSGETEKRAANVVRLPSG